MDYIESVIDCIGKVVATIVLGVALAAIIVTPYLQMEILKELKEPKVIHFNMEPKQNAKPITRRSPFRA